MVFALRDEKQKIYFCKIKFCFSVFLFTFFILKIIFCFFLVNRFVFNVRVNPSIPPRASDARRRPLGRRVLARLVVVYRYY